MSQNRKTEEERIEEIIALQRQRRAKIFMEAAFGESVESLGCAETKIILETYLEYLDEFV